MSSDKPRIPLLPQSEWTKSARCLRRAGRTGSRKGAALRHHPDAGTEPALTRPSRIQPPPHVLLVADPRVRELVTLYVAWTCKSEYEWLSHVREGLRIGLSDDDIEAVKLGPLRRIGMNSNAT